MLKLVIPCAAPKLKPPSCPWVWCVKSGGHMIYPHDHLTSCMLFCVERMPIYRLQNLLSVERLRGAHTLGWSADCPSAVLTPERLPWNQADCKRCVSAEVLQTKERMGANIGDFDQHVTFFEWPYTSKLACNPWQIMESLHLLFTHLFYFIVNTQIGDIAQNNV